MSKFRDLIIEIQEQIELGEKSFKQIAEENGVTLDFVDDVAHELMENYGDVDA